MKNVIQITDKILGVIVPERANIFKISGIGYLCYKNTKYDSQYQLIEDLIFSNHKIHGTCTLPAFEFDFEVNESWVKDTEEKLTWKKYYNYNTKMYSLDTKEDSFRTRIQKAIQDEGMFVLNPYGENKPQELVDYTGRKDGIIANSLEFEQWQSAESKTVKKLLLIEKI